MQSKIIMICLGTVTLLSLFFWARSYVVRQIDVVRFEDNRILEDTIKHVTASTTERVQLETHDMIVVEAVKEINQTGQLNIGINNQFITLKPVTTTK